MSKLSNTWIFAMAGFTKLLLREDGKVKMLSYQGAVRDSTWHGWWTRDASGHLEVSVSYRGFNPKLISIPAPPIRGFGLREVFRNGRLKAIVSKLGGVYRYCMWTGTWRGVRIE